MATPSRSPGGVIGYLSLFTSLGTLVCCALPSLFVLFGLGAAVASVLSEAPWLVAMSRHKIWVFLVSGTSITANFVWIYWLAPKNTAAETCDPADPNAACATASRFSRVLLWISAGIFVVGSFTAWGLGPILVYFDQ